MTCFVSTSAWAGEFDVRIAAEATRIEADVIRWRRTFHQNPEKPNEEFETARVVAEHLKALGFDHVVTEIGGTGVVGILRGGSPGPTVALRADMDAVPGVKERNDLPFRSTKNDVAHLCGHDGNTAMLMGAADVLSHLKADLAGNVMFIFQPAEETSVKADGSRDIGRLQGARRMLEEGLFSDRFLEGKYRPSVIFGQHFVPRDAGEVSFVAGSRLFSADDFKFIIGAAPNVRNTTASVNARPYLDMARLIEALNGFPSRPAGLNLPHPSYLAMYAVHSQETSSESKLRRSIELSARMGAATEEARQAGLTWIRDTARNVERDTDTSIQLAVHSYAPAIINDPALVSLLRPSMIDAVGSDHLKEEPYFVPAADDFALFQQDTPGIYIFLGGNRAGVRAQDAAPNHSSQYFLNEDVLIYGVKILSTLTADYLEIHKSMQSLKEDSGLPPHAGCNARGSIPPCG